MFKSHVLGRPFGVEVRLHGTVLLLVAVLAFFALLGSGLAGALEAVLLIGLVLASVTLHELGHIAAARLFGIGTTGVTLFPFGGVAQLTREARTPTEEVVVAVAGPAVNLVLAGLAALPVALFGWVEPFGTLLAVNVALMVFNLIPAYPMDGGRVFRGALWPYLGRRTATLWAARAGQGFAVLFGIAGLFLNPMLIVIAAFVFLQATAEIGRLRATERPAYGPVHGWGLGHWHTGDPADHDPPRPPVVPRDPRAGWGWGGGGRAPEPPRRPARAPGRFVAIRTPWGTVVRYEAGPMGS